MSPTATTTTPQYPSGPVPLTKAQFDAMMRDRAIVSQGGSGQGQGKGREQVRGLFVITKQADGTWRLSEGYPTVEQCEKAAAAAKGLCLDLR